MFMWFWYLLFLTIGYGHSEISPPSDGVSKVLLQTLLQNAAGIFVDPKRQIGLEHTVLVTGCNHGFLNHLLNFKCFADRLGLKFLVVAMDEKVHQYLTKHTNILS